MKVLYLQAKTILNKSKLKNIDYTINPYIGCTFACKYCYASYLSNLVKEDNENWGKFIYVKQNAINLLKKELAKIKLNFKEPTIMLSSATDPYQYIEIKEKLTQQILKTFIEFNFTGRLICLTKSPLILRDLDILKKINNTTLCVSIANNNKKIKEFFEPDVPSIRSRLFLLKKLNENGFETCAFIAPILPYYKNHINELEDLFREIKNTGTKNIVCDLLNLYGNMTRYKNCFKDSPKGQDLYLNEATKKDYQENMTKIIENLIDKYNFIHYIN